MMFSGKMSPLLVTGLTTMFVILTISSSIRGTNGAETYQAKCETGVNSQNVTVDTCDVSKFLTCHSGRCLCQDQANQIWTHRSYKVSSSSRSKRSPKKGGSSKGSGKKIAAGVAAGAVGGYVASNVAHNIRNGGSSSSSSSSSSRKERVERISGCYSRVGGQCVLDSANIHGDVIVAFKSPASPQESSTTTTSTTTTTGVPPTVIPGAVNKTGDETTTPAPNATTTTTTAGAPQAMAQTSQFSYDVVKIPKCIDFAECVPKTVKIVDGKVLEGHGSNDPRIGQCQCQNGYKANSADVCVKTNGASLGSGVSLSILLLSISASLVSKFYSV